MFEGESQFENKNISLKEAEKKLQDLKLDKEKIDADLEKYFFTKKDDESLKTFFNEKDSFDYNDLVSRRAKLKEKIEKWEKIVDGLKTQN